MIQRIKTWFSNYKEKQRRKQVLRIIINAKQEYLDNNQDFMCFCFCRVASFKCYDDIVKRIPEFKPSTFGSDRENAKGAWWSTIDRESRIKAFDKLIEIYSK